MNLKRFPRHHLTFGVTPIHPLKRLSAHLGGKVDLYAKRDDCNSGLAFGGNKTRKLEYLIPEALAQGCDTLVSIGGVQSNQTRQVAAVAAHLGMKCVLVQENWVEYPDALYDRVGNIELSRILGADVRLDTAGFDIGIRPSWERALEDVRRTGGRPFAIPAGCSEHPLGGLGFVGFAEEVGLPGELWSMCVELGEMYRKQGDERQANRTFARAAEILHSLADTMEDQQQRTSFLSAPVVKRVVEHVQFL